VARGARLPASQDGAQWRTRFAAEGEAPGWDFVLAGRATAPPGLAKSGRREIVACAANLLSGRSLPATVRPISTSGRLRRRVWGGRRLSSAPASVRYERERPG